MNEEIRIDEYNLLNHPVTGTCYIELNDEHKTTLLNVPMEPFAVTTYYRCLFNVKRPSIPLHRMLLGVILTTGYKMQKVVVDDLKKGVFFATIYFANSEGVEFAAQAEASDAIVMSLCQPCVLYVTKSVVHAAKNDPANRVYWYNPDDERSLKVVRAASYEDLLNYPVHELEQLRTIAVDIEDFEFAARLKKALDTILDEQQQLIDAVQEVYRQDPSTFMRVVNEGMRIQLRNALKNKPDDDDNTEK
jgi:bifunctional DNase/RNase